MARVIEWRPVPGYEGFYEVSNSGQVKSIYRYKKILKPMISNTGYERVDLFKNKVRKQFSVHRLVAMAFIDNKDKKPFVNHKDENKRNNNVDNLEWVTHIENCHYGTAIKRRTENLDYQKRVVNNARQIEACSKPVSQYKKDGTFIRKWRSASECSRATGITISSIRRSATGERKTAGGFIFKEVTV